MRSYNEITYRYLKLQKKRTILAVLGIVLSVALITAIFTMAVSLRDKEIRNVIKNTGDFHARFNNVTGDKVAKISNNVDVESYAVTSKIGTAIINKTSEKELQRNPGKEPYSYLIINAFDSAAFKSRPIDLKEGRYPQNSEEMIIDISSLENFENPPKIGDKIKLELGVRKDKDTGRETVDDDWGTNGMSWSDDEVFETKDDQQFTIVGFSNSRVTSSVGPFSYGVTFMERGFWDKEVKYNVYVKATSTRNIYNKLENMASNLNLPELNEKNREFKYDITVNKRLLKLYAQSLNPSEDNSIMAILIIFVILVIVCTVAVIYNAFQISVLERISQFGILRCAGASPKQITDIVFKEAGILSFIGIPLGLFSGFFSMKLVLYIISRFNYKFLGDIHIVVSPYIFIAGTLLGLVTVYLSAYGPARQAGRVSPMEAVRNTGNFKKEKIKKVRSSRIAKSVFGIEGEIAFKNLRRNRKRFKITAFSMVISIVLYIVFSSFISFLMKSEFISLSKQADIRVYTNQGNEGIDEKIINDIRAHSEIDKVYKFMRYNTNVLLPTDKIIKKALEFRGGYDLPNIDTKMNNLSVLYSSEILSYGDSGLEDIKKMLKEGSIDKEWLNRENGVIVVKTGMLYSHKSNKTAVMDVADIRVGDTIKITMDNRLLSSERTKDIEYKEVKVLAIAEKGLFNEEYNYNGGVNFITTEEVFSRLTDQEENDQLLVTLKEGAEKEPVINFLKELKEKEPRYGYTDYVELLKESRKNSITISIFAYGFIGVIILIGCLNIVNTISTNLILRTKELSMLKAVGMTKRAIEKLVALEAIFYGTIAAFYGGVIGTVITYVLFRFLIDVREFEWTMPWTQIFTAIIGAVVVALISGLIPLRKINKGNIIKNIRMVE
jgi:putative ABC transport system permease protein